ncbi:MAG: hypothetical protein GY914_03960, partial [Prochlorococcus sp.]|nr:hypothetical protein [Prochlorococcus sp.]
NFTTTLKNKLDGISASANNYSLPASVVHDTEKGALHATDALRISGHTVSLYKGDGTSESVVIPDNNTTYSSGDFNHDSLSGFVANEHIDWTASSAGTIHLTNLPATALTTVQTAVSQAAMLALTAEEGDVVVRSDQSKTYMHNGGSAGTMADFTELATPTDSVTSVDGATGAVTLNHDSLSGFVANEHIDWTTNQGATNIHSGNYTNTTYSVGDGGLTQKNFTTTLKDKLDNIASGATNVTNNNQLTNGAGYITGYVNTVDMGDGFKIANSAGTDQFTVTENEEVRFAGSGATSVSFDAATQKVTISSTDNNTTYSVGDGGLTQKNFTSTLKTKLDGIAENANNYSHPTHPGDDINLDTGALTGATVISDLDFNVTTDTKGHVTDANAAYSTRSITAANVGALPITGGTMTG